MEERAKNGRFPNFAQTLHSGTGFFVNFDTFDVSYPNFSRAFGARAGIMGYADGECAKK